MWQPSGSSNSWMPHHVRVWQELEGLKAAQRLQVTEARACEIARLEAQLRFLET